MSDWKETLPVAFFISSKYRSQRVGYPMEKEIL